MGIYLLLTFHCHQTHSILTGYCLLGVLAPPVKHTDSNSLSGSLCQLFSSVVFIFPGLAQDLRAWLTASTKAVAFLWVISLDVHPIIKHFPYCWEVYSETFLQIPVCPSRRTAVSAAMKISLRRLCELGLWCSTTDRHPTPALIFILCCNEIFGDSPNKDICPGPH